MLKPVFNPLSGRFDYVDQQSSHTYPEVTFVDPSSTGTGVIGDMNRPFPTLQAATDAGVDGMTIFLMGNMSTFSGVSKVCTIFGNGKSLHLAVNPNEDITVHHAKVTLGSSGSGNAATLRLYDCVVESANFFSQPAIELYDCKVEVDLQFQIAKSTVFESTSTIFRAVANVTDCTFKDVLTLRDRAGGVIYNNKFCVTDNTQAPIQWNNNFNASQQDGDFEFHDNIIESTYAYAIEEIGTFNSPSDMNAYNNTYTTGDFANITTNILLTDHNNRKVGDSVITQNEVNIISGGNTLTSTVNGISDTTNVINNLELNVNGSDLEVSANGLTVTEPLVNFGFASAQDISDLQDGTKKLDPSFTPTVNEDYVNYGTVLELTGTPSVETDIIYVSESATGIGVKGNINRPYSVQEMLNNSTAGDSIVFLAGDYTITQNIAQSGRSYHTIGRVNLTTTDNIIIWDFSGQTPSDILIDGDFYVTINATSLGGADTGAIKCNTQATQDIKINISELNLVSSDFGVEIDGCENLDIDFNFFAQTGEVMRANGIASISAAGRINVSGESSSSLPPFTINWNDTRFTGSIVCTGPGFKNIVTVETRNSFNISLRQTSLGSGDDRFCTFGNSSVSGFITGGWVSPGVSIDTSEFNLSFTGNMVSVIPIVFANQKFNLNGHFSNCNFITRNDIGTDVAKSVMKVTGVAVNGSLSSEDISELHFSCDTNQMDFLSFGPLGRVFFRDCRIDLDSDNWDVRCGLLSIENCLVVGDNAASMIISNTGPTVFKVINSELKNKGLGSVFSSSRFSDIVLKDSIITSEGANAIEETQSPTFVENIHVYGKTWTNKPVLQNSAGNPNITYLIDGFANIIVDPNVEIFE